MTIYSSYTKWRKVYISRQTIICIRLARLNKLKKDEGYRVQLWAKFLRFMLSVKGWSVTLRAVMCGTIILVKTSIIRRSPKRSEWHAYSVALPMRAITNFDTRQMALPPQELSCWCVVVGGIDNWSKNKRGTLCCVPNCNNFGRHTSLSEATAKNAWIKWLDEPEKTQTRMQVAVPCWRA